MTFSKITAIVSAYFAENFLERRLENLLVQETRPKIVVVCQEDSAEEQIAKGFSDTGKVVIVSTPDVPTIYAAWNYAIGVSETEYLTNANSDDLLYPGALKEMQKVLDKNVKAAVVYADADIVNNLGQIVGKFEWAEGGLERLLQGCFVGPMPVWRRSLHAVCGLFNPLFHVAGDYEFWLRVASKGYRFHHIQKSLGAYTERKDSAEHREPMRTAWETARARSLYREKESNNGAK